MHKKHFVVYFCRNNQNTNHMRSEVQLLIVLRFLIFMMAKRGKLKTHKTFDHNSFFLNEIYEASHLAISPLFSLTFLLYIMKISIDKTHRNVK